MRSETSVALAIAALLLTGVSAAAGQSVARVHSEQCADGDLRSCTVLGLIYQSGAAGVTDVDRAIALYERACARDVGAACSRLEMARSGDSFAVVDEFHRVGRVADGGDGAPIAEAVVDLPRLGVRALSDESGRVELGRLPRGTYRIVTRAGGYVTTNGNLPVPWDSEFLILLDRSAMEEEAAFGRIFGQVRVAGTQVGIPDVAVTLVDGATDVGTVTNQDGRFTLARLEPGTVEVELTRLGYETRRTTVRVEPGRTVEVYAEMAQEPIELDPIEVQVGSMYLDRTGFYRRARRARGERFTRRDVVELDPIVLSDLLWRTPGVAVRTGPVGSVILSRRPSVAGADTSTCRLRPYLDGVPMWDWDPDLVRPDDLQAMEVYQGSATPVEYRQPSDPDGTYACGVVLIWTRRNN